MDVSDDPTSFDSVALHEHAGTLEIQNDAPDTTKDGYDTLGLESEHDTFTHTEASQQEMEQFLLSAGVEVSEGNHGKHADAGVSQELELDMEVEGGHDHHGALMEGILDLASHELHGDDHLHLDLEPHQEPATFDLHQIHQELNDATSLSEHHHDSADASAAQPDTSVLGEEATCHPSLDRTLFDSNLAPSPNDRGLPLVPHLQEEPVPTGIQIVNEEVLVNDIGLSPMGEGLPSTEAMGMVKQEAELVAEQVQGQHFDATSQQPGRSAAEMLKTPSGGNPPLPIDHALTEPITAFYKLQFLEPPPAQSSGSHNDYRPKEAFSYYMQTLDVTIGRKINRLKKAVLDQPLQPRASADEEMGPGTEGMKVEHDGQTLTAKEAEHDVKVESSAVFQEQSVMTKNNDGGNAPEDGKRSTPPDVPPAKEIAKPPIDDQPPQQDIADAPESEHNKSLIMGRGAEEEDIQTSIRIIKSESNHKVVSGRDGVHGEDMDERQVDVDLGALKSVSRLHARIGYSYTLSQFYLDVLGRNGAWVDDVFKVKGSRVALGPYTKIQISTRTFYFILPPASIASYPIPLNHNALTGPGVESLGFGVTGPKVPSQPAVSDNENDLHHLFQRPATFNAFSTNREEWEDERMGLFGMGKGMGKNGAYGYRSRHRKGRKCRKCKLQESEHKDEHREDLDHSFSGSDNEHGNGEDSNDSVCSCSRCASEQEWFSSSVDSDADESSELSSVSDSDEESDVDSSSEESDGVDEHEEKEEEEEDAQQNTADPYKATEAPIKEVPEVKGNATEDSTKQGERGVADDKGVVVPSTEAMEPSVQSDSVMAASDAESEEETLASKLKVAELLKPTASRLPAPPQFSDDQASHMHLEDSSHLPPTEADIQAVQDLIASTMTPTDEQGMPLQTPQSGMPYDNSMFSSLDSSHVPMEGEGLVPVPEVKLTKAEKSALAARIREAKAAARKEEQERKKAEKAAQREKDKAEKAKAKADAAAAKAAKKQKAEALEREKMLARMESMQQPQADDYTMDVLDIPANSSADTAHTGVSSYPPGVRPGMPRPAATTGQGLVRPGMPGVRPARPMPNGYRPVNATGPNAMAAPGFRPLRPGLNGMPIRPGMSGVRPGMSGPSIRPGPGSVPPLQAQMRPGMQARPPQPGLRPVRPGPPIRPGSRPILPPQRPPLQPHMNSGSFGESRDGSRGMSPDAMSIHSQEGLSRSPSLDPHSQKRISPLLGIDGQPFIGPDPIKPDLTYATIIYRALANVDRGRGTLGQVCDWVAKEWEWFRMNPESGWQNSIRHNLSLNKAFLKVPRVPEDDPESKGSVWILDPVHAPELVERERKAAEQKEARAKRDSDKGPNIVKPMKPRKPTDGMLRRDSDDHARPSPSPAPSNAPAANSVEAILGSLIPPLLVPLNRQLPLVLGAIPPHLKSVDIKIKHLLPEPPYVFDNNTIILNPLVFGRFSKQQLAQMQALPTKSAITVLRTYVLRWLQEKVKKLGPASLPRLGNPAIRPTAAGPGSRPPGGIPIARPGVVPRPQGIRPTPGQVRPVAAGVRPAIARPGIAPRPLPNGDVSARPAIRPGASAARPAPRPINGNATGARPPTPALDPETLRKITQLAESAIKTNSAQSANAKVLLQYLKQVGSHVNIAIATQILSTGVIPPNAIPVRPTQIAGTGGTGIPSIRPGIRPPAVTPRPNPTTVLGKRPVEASSGSVTDSADAKRQKV